MANHIDTAEDDTIVPAPTVHKEPPSESSRSLTNYTDVCSSLVSGVRLTTTGAQFLVRAKKIIEDELRRRNPDTEYIDFVCQAVRLWREHEALATRCGVKV